MARECQTESDAIEEGIRLHESGSGYTFDGNKSFPTAKEAYLDLWARLYGKKSLDRNDWVWVVPFTLSETKTNRK